MKITKIEHPIEESKKKVAAYARVSTLQEEQEESFDTQVKYYTAYIQSNPKWEFVNLYSDQGISGTSISKRPGFKKMIDDAKSGLIDLILVKSISRFGRNSYESQSVLHELKMVGVEVFFERENISSFDPTSEMLLNFMTAIAQEESRSISENVIWTYDRLGAKGIRKVGSEAPYGYKEVHGKFVIDKKESEMVRKIFDWCLEGISTLKIIDMLYENGYRPKKGAEKFSPGTIRGMLMSEIYCGDRLIQRQPHQNYLTKYPDPTRPYKQFYVENNHEGIITKEEYQAVQKLLGTRKLERKTSVDGKRVTCNTRSHPYRGKVFCAICGAPFYRTTYAIKGVMTKVWRCLGRDKKNGCTNHYVKESDLIQIPIPEDPKLKIYVKQNKTLYIGQKRPKNPKW